MASVTHTSEAPPWRLPMVPRNRDEQHRASTPLELLFDLCFVVGVSQTAGRLHHALAEDHIAHGVAYYLMVFFAIWWAWVNFTWFASAYDNDDVQYRLTTMVQITGALILAAGVPRAFDREDFTVVVIGYVVMRLALVTQWLRVAANDRERRVTALRFATGIAAVQLGWIFRLWLPHGWGLPSFLALVICELLVPIWAEHAAPTTWHRSHIAERYGLFTLIVLGESVVAVAAATSSNEWHVWSATVAILGFVAVGAIWWLYYDRQALVVLTGSTRSVVIYSYAHLPLLMGLAALSAGIRLAIEESEHDHLAGGAAFAVCGGVALFLGSLIVTRVLTVTGPVRLGLALKLSTLIVVLLLLLLQPVASPALLVGLVALALVVLVYLQRTYVDPQNPT
jgi:low temperature requirement protein LtrA